MGCDINKLPLPWALTITSPASLLTFTEETPKAQCSSCPDCLGSCFCTAMHVPSHARWPSGQREANKQDQVWQAGEQRGEKADRLQRGGWGAGREVGSLPPTSDCSAFVFAALHRGRKCWIFLSRDKIAVKAIWVTSPITLLSRAGVGQAGPWPSSQHSLHDRRKVYWSLQAPLSVPPTEHYAPTPSFSL